MRKEPKSTTRTVQYTQCQGDKAVRWAGVSLC